MGSAWEGARFPLLAKYIFTSDWLSVQVHPDDDYARVHDPGNLGKCEMWYIVQADPKAEILVAVKPGVTREALKSAFEKGTSKDLLIRHRPKAEEAVFLPPGTVHALGPGLVLFEVEQNSDLTYRLDDYGRLAWTASLVLSIWQRAWTLFKEDLPPLCRLPRWEFQEPFGTRRYVAGVPLLRTRGNVPAQESDLQEFTATSGGLFRPAGRRTCREHRGLVGLPDGETWVIPPAAGAYRFAPLQDNAPPEVSTFPTSCRTFGGRSRLATSPREDIAKGLSLM